MNTGRAVILNPSRPDSVKRREFLLDSFLKSGLEWSEDISDCQIVITWQGEPKRGRPTPEWLWNLQVLPGGCAGSSEAVSTLLWTARHSLFQCIWVHS